jgi:hypothetical protein
VLFLVFFGALLGEVFLESFSAVRFSSRPGISGSLLLLD